VDFTKNERLFLLNQYKILENLYPDEAEFYSRAQRIVSDGYSFEYASLAPSINEDSGLTSDECREVVHVLQMYEQLIFSYEKLEDKGGVKPVSFDGFSGNEETAQMSYARFLVERGRWPRFRNHDMDSHVPMLSSYQSMLPVWESLTKSFLDHKGFSKDEITRIIQAQAR